MDNRENSAEQYHLVNAFDEIVRQNVRTHMEYMDMCKCEKCFLDTCALVFNNGYTQFVTTRAGEVYAKVPQMSVDYNVDMTVAIMDALNMVAKSPKH